MTKERRTAQLYRRAIVAVGIAGLITGYGLAKYEPKEPQPKCEWEACDCTDPFGNPLYYNVHYHCSVHEHSEECTLGIYP